MNTLKKTPFSAEVPSAADVADIAERPMHGFYVNGIRYETFDDAKIAMRELNEATLDLYEDVTITTAETFPSGASNTAGLVFANRSQSNQRRYTVNGHGHRITLSTFAADGILVAGYAAEQAKDLLTVHFRNLEVVCSDDNVFRAFQVSNATATFVNVTMNSKKKNVLGVNGGAVIVDGESVLSYDGGWEPIGIDNGTGADNASCTLQGAAKVLGTSATSKSIANVENGHGTASSLVISGGQFDTLPNLSADAGASVAISGGRFRVPVTQNLCAEGFVPHDFNDGTYRYGVVAS